MLGFVAFGVIDAFLALMVVGTMYAGNGVPALVLGAIAGWIALSLVAMWPTVFRVRKRWWPDVVTADTTGSGERGVRLSQSAKSYAIVVTLVAYTGVLLAVVAVWELVAGIPIFDEPGEGPAFALLAALTALAILKFLFDVARGRRVPSRVLLTARGVYYHADQKDDEVFVPWDSLLVVVPWHGRRQARIAVTLVGLPGTVEHLSPSNRNMPGRWVERLLGWRGPSGLGKGVVVVHAQRLAVDPSLAYCAIGYYWGRHDARDELSTENGLQRIRSGDLMVWFPDARAKVLAAVRALAHHENLEPVPREHYDEIATRQDGRSPSTRPERFPSPSYGDDLVMHMKVLFDEIAVLPDPRKDVGPLLHDDEVPILRRLGSALDPLVEDLGSRPSWYYVADPRWSDVVVQAERAARVMAAHS